MRPERKRAVMDVVRRAPLAKRQTLAELGLAASTYYRWQQRWRQHGEAGLEDQRPQPGTGWNRLRPAAEARIRAEAPPHPARGPREPAYRLIASAGVARSRATVDARP